MCKRERERDERARAALLIQHPKFMRRFIPSAACQDLQYFFQVISSTTQFSGKKILNTKRVSIFSTTFV
jgi:hypothetical protein